MRAKLTVEFAKLSKLAKLPTQGSAQAAGWDLYALEETKIERRKSSMIRTGLAVAIPEGWEGQIRCRSSLGKKRNDNAKWNWNNRFRLSRRINGTGNLDWRG